jgi:hypothetical protein
MIDRWGRRINVGWADYEVLWVEAAVTLPTRIERYAAYEDISAMTGRSFAAVFRYAARLEDEARNRTRRLAEARRQAARAKLWTESTPA